ncbi:PQQ-binding-like beta-propeller repeat protein [Cellulomonas sp. zg-ZUI199]|uniref:PQQ-binding-like beta-propeller repeat protein n=1 Tax=Cellulomonas wangleii TaxID=2816956 RepID=A0ABX8D5Y8_9CELL|nr:PQQ-binding-like beta-propeller repeat protein [Cellulomonas wangleii]MBO0924669.1 PQQ-binding-like beta-propeller repeat protein [Cellulomonas wangleii]QVI62858.1 PQQ-binding-like beta-propeller repeat protein [Cellulomonas wangleii]
MARRGHLHEVEVVDDVDPGGATPDPSPPGGAAAGDGDPAAGSGRRRVALLVGAGLVVALVVAGVVGQVVVDRRERALIAAVAALPYSVDLLTRPPEPAWETTTRYRLQIADVRTPDGLLVSVPAATQGPVAVTAVDAATGSEVWRTEVLDGSTHVDPRTGARALSFPGRCEQAGSRADLVTCWVDDGVEVLTADGSAEIPPTVTRVLTLDARDGSVVTDVTGALGAGVMDASFAAVADVVVVALPTEGGADVVAVGPDGAERWRTTVALPEGADEQWFSVRTVGDLVSVSSPTALRLLDAHGRTVRSWGRDADSPYIAAELVAGRVHVVAYPQEGSDATDPDDDVRTTVLLPEGDVELAGYPLVALDDGSVPGLLLTMREDGVTAWDVAGEELWTRDGWVAGNAVLIGGRLHLAGESAVVTLDARTGEVMWESTAMKGTIVPDGRHLLGLARAPSTAGEPELVALDPADGTEMWRSPLPEGTEDVTVSGRMLVAVDSTVGDDLTLTVLR